MASQHLHHLMHGLLLYTTFLLISPRVVGTSPATCPFDEGCTCGYLTWSQDNTIFCEGDKLTKLPTLKHQTTNTNWTMMIRYTNISKIEDLEMPHRLHELNLIESNRRHRRPRLYIFRRYTSMGHHRVHQFNFNTTSAERSEQSDLT